MHDVVVHPDVGTVTGDDFLEARADLPVCQPESAAAVPEALRDASDPAVFVCANREWEDVFANALSRGDWVATSGAGYDSYPITEFEDRGITFTNTPGIHAAPIGEHVFGTLFSFSRQLLTFRDRQRDHEWDKFGPPLTDFSGEVCCIVGLGRIGEPLASRARAFDFRVRGVKRSPEGYRGPVDEVYGPGDLQEGLADAAAVVVAVPLTDETRGMIGREELRSCDDAILVNVARGPVVDTGAVLDALDAGDLRGAALDVFDTEPLPTESPLWDRDDVLVTPHCAGLSAKYPDRFLSIFFDRYDTWLGQDEVPDSIV